MIKQSKRENFLLDECERDKAKLDLQEEKLEELRLKIHQLQCKNTLKQKVILFDGDSRQTAT